MRLHVNAGLDWDGHLLLLHHTEQERSSKLAAWVRRGLENDEKVVYTEAREIGRASCRERVCAIV